MANEDKLHEAIMEGIRRAEDLRLTKVHDIATVVEVEIERMGLSVVRRRKSPMLTQAAPSASANTAYTDGPQPPTDPAKAP
jgi:hypothetical protein